MKNLFLTKTRWLVTIIALITFGIGKMWGTTQAVPLGTYYKLSSIAIPHNDAYILKFTGNYILCNSNAGTDYITQNSYGSDPASITITDSNKDLVWNVVNYSSGSFTLRGPNGEAYTAGNKKASVVANGSTWSISSDYLKTGSYYMKWVSASGFRCYNTTNNKTTLNAIYKKAVAAASSNTSYGTVSISGDIVTATPTSGYRVSTGTPYTISPSNKATVSQSGNVFTLSNFSDTVRITIHFEAAAPSCDKSVTLAQSVTNGTATFDPTGPVETCSETASDRQVSVSITPTTGYELTSGPTVSGVTGATISGSGPYTIQLPQNGNGELTLSATCSAISVTGVSLNKNSTTIAEGSTETLTATITPSNALDQAVTWLSGTPGVATVNSSGVVTAVSAGNATITVTTHDGSYTATCTVTVTAVPKDHFIDEVQGTIIADKTSAYNFSSVTISDKATATSGTCEQVHYHFVGWITKAKYDAGTAIGDGDIQSGNKTPNNTTYYAVWAKQAAGGGSAGWYETDIADLTSDDVFVLATPGGYAVSNDNGTSSAPTAISITVSNNKITSTVNNNMKWNISGNSTDGYTFYRNGSTTTWLYCNTTASSGSNNNIRVGTGDRKYWIADGDGDYVTNDTYTDRWLCNYNNADFRGYVGSSVTSDIVSLCYKYEAGVSYEDPIASCGAEYDITIDENNASASCTSCGAKVTANATALSNLVAPTWAGHQVDYYMVASADNSTKIAEADGTLAANVTVSSTPWTDANGKWVKGDVATFYAKWKATECVITLNNEGADTGHEGTTSVTATYGASTNLTSDIDVPTKNGYDFGGYYTAANGSGVKLINADGSWVASASGGGNTYTNASKQWQYDATSLELHAEWTLRHYTVTWIVNGTDEATQTNVAYGFTYGDLTNEPTVDNDAIEDACGSDRFVGWVTQEYTAEGGTAALQYDPYKVTASTIIDDTHHTFYAMFATEEGTAFTLDGTVGSTQECQISADVSGTVHYATGNVTSSKIESTTTASSASTYVFTKLAAGVYSIGLKGATGNNTYITKASGNTDLGTSSTNTNNSEKWTITASNAGKGSWSIASNSTTTRGIIYGVNQTKFGSYLLSDGSGNNVLYYFVELGVSNLTDYRTGCCDEKITLTVSDATSGVGGTVTMKWNNADKSSGDQVSTCSQGTLVAKIIANPSYSLTAVAISGTNKTITTNPANLATGLPSTSEMTYTVTVPAEATGTLAITPTFSRTYTVTYDLDGGETSGSTTTASYLPNTTVTFVTPNPTKSGYNFTGWVVNKAGGGTQSATSTNFSMPSDNVTIVAQWSAKPLNSITVTPTTATVYVGQYVELPVTYDPADILTKGYTLVSTPSWCVTTNSTNTTLKITGGRSGATINEDKTETVSIKATADNTKTASVTVTVKPLPVDHFVDLIHNVSFDDKGASIVNNVLQATYSAPGYATDYSGATAAGCETEHLHLIGWIDSEWADANPKATQSQITSAPGYHVAYEAGMTANNKTYYAVWGHEVTD